MTWRWLVVGCWVVAVAAGCGSDGDDAPGTVSIGDGGGDGDGDGDAGPIVPPDAGQPEPDEDAGELPDAPSIDGVHVSVQDGPFETTTDAFLFETIRPGIQAELDGATLRVDLSEQPGTLRCSDGFVIDYVVDDGELRASNELGSCTIVVEAFGTMPNDRIVATFEATVERTRGEVADSLELRGRIQVGHP